MIHSALQRNAETLRKVFGSILFSHPTVSLSLYISFLILFCCFFDSITIRSRVFNEAIINRPSLWRPPVYKLACFFYSWSVGVTYEQSAVKLVVGVIKSGTGLYKTSAHVNLLNVTYLCSCLLIYSI